MNRADKTWAHFYKTKYFKNQSFQKISFTKVDFLMLIFNIGMQTWFDAQLDQKNLLQYLS